MKETSFFSIKCFLTRFLWPEEMRFKTHSFTFTVLLFSSAWQKEESKNSSYAH